MIVNTALIYLLCINLLAFAAYGLDKWKAVHDRWRTSEKALISLAIIGGSIGALLGMRIFRHKTRKPLFYIGVPAILILQAALLPLVLIRLY